MVKKYPLTPEIRLWSDLCLLDVYEDEIALPLTDEVEQWLYRTRLRAELLRRMRVTYGKRP